jgi:two-component system chemotaxis response regulator CheY
MQTRPNLELAASGLCILVVEDDDADAYLIGRALEDNPAVGTLFHARDGIEALAMMDRNEVAPDLVLIDLQMPRMDGFGLLFALAGRPGPNVPKVVLTSSSSPSDAIRSRLRSATRVVTKPDTITEMYAVLKTTIEAVCRRPHAPTIEPRPGTSPDYLFVSPPAAGLRRHPTLDDDACG